MTTMTEYDNDQAAYADFHDQAKAVRKRRGWPAIAWPAFSADHLEVAKIQASAAPSPPSPPSPLPNPAAVAAAAIPPAQVQAMLKDAYAASAAEKQANIDALWAAQAEKLNREMGFCPRNLSLKDETADAPARPSQSAIDAMWAARAAETNKRLA